MSFVSYLEKNDRDISESHCITTSTYAHLCYLHNTMHQINSFYQKELPHNSTALAFFISLVFFPVHCEIIPFIRTAFNAISWLLCVTQTQRVIRNTKTLVGMMALFLGFSHKDKRGVGYLCIHIDYHVRVIEFINGNQYDISHGKHTGLPPVVTC